VKQKTKTLSWIRRPMQKLMKEPKARGGWLENKRKEFDAITE
jgi:hypothetical protein